MKMRTPLRGVAIVGLTLLAAGSGTGRLSGETPTAQEKAEQDRKKLEQDYAEARAVRDLANKEKQAFLVAYHRMLEERRRRRADRERRRRIKRVDPDRNAFWRLETRSRFGKEIALSVPTESRLVIYRWDNPLQLHGFRAHKVLKYPRVRAGIPIPADRTDITKLIRSRRGHFVILVFPGEKPTRTNFELPVLRWQGEEYELINLYSDGVDIIRLEMERKVGQGRAGGYHHWAVDKVLLERR